MTIVFRGNQYLYCLFSITMSHCFVSLKLLKSNLSVNLEFQLQKQFLSPEGKSIAMFLMSCVFVSCRVNQISVKMQGNPPHVTMKNRGHIILCPPCQQNVPEERLILLRLTTLPGWPTALNTIRIKLRWIRDQEAERRGIGMMLVQGFPAGMWSLLSLLSLIKADKTSQH